MMTINEIETKLGRELTSDEKLVALAAEYSTRYQGALRRIDALKHKLTKAREEVELAEQMAATTEKLLSRLVQECSADAESEALQAARSWLGAE